MARLLGFFVLVLVVLRVLQTVPVVGGWFRGLLGFWLVALLVSAALARLAVLAASRRRLRQKIAELSNVDSARNRGKLGALYLAHGRPALAVELLAAALESDPENVEWRYRLGLARLALGERAEARAELERVLAADEEYAYGAAQLALAQTALAEGDAQAALGALERFEANHGESPESLYRRGRALKLAGRRAEARAAFARVPKLAARAPAFERRRQAGWVARSYLARFL